jgi:hypothetical protein
MHRPNHGLKHPMNEDLSAGQQRVGAKLRGWPLNEREGRCTVKYLCFGYYDKTKFDGMTEAERNAMFDTCFEYDDHLRASGHWAGGEALQGQETALTLSWKNGKVATTDGPYAETKEQLGGILVLEARDMNHAVQLMAQHPALTYGNTFEIRPAADMTQVFSESEKRRKHSMR